MSHPDYHDAREDYEQAWQDWAATTLFRRGLLLVVVMFAFMIMSDAFRLLPVTVTVILNFVPLALFLYFCNPKRLRRDFESNHALDEYVRRREAP